MKIEKSDRRLLIWVAVVFLPLIIALSLLSQEDEESAVPSTYSAQSRGAKAAFLLLQEAGYNVERWERPPGELPETPVQTTLVLASPFRAPSLEEKNALRKFVSRGGKIVATGSTPWMYLPFAEIEREPLPAPVGKEYQPQLLTPLTRGGAIQMSPAGYWNGKSAVFLAHYADEGRPIVVSYRVGKGEVIWWGASMPLTNAAIAKSGNLALLLNSLGPPGEVHVFWDEYFHGHSESFSGYLAQRPVLYGLIQCLLVFMALLFTFSRRNGPIHPLAQPSRLSPLEFVHTLGKLYQRGGVTHSALLVPYARFRMLATRRLGIASDVAAPELAQALKSSLRYADDQLPELFSQIETALSNPELSEARALELVQRLSFHMQNMKLIPPDRQETISHADSVPRAYARTN